VAAVTPFQTVGPFLRLGLRDGLARPAHPRGARVIAITGRLLDGAGEGVPDGFLEFWHPGQPRVQRAATENDGTFAVETIKPEATPGPGGVDQAPHLVVRVLGRGILTEYLTRIYFADESRNAVDPVLQLVPAHRRETLIASPVTEGAYRLDIVLQGEGETVFFDAE
jgi:protocatechuate 3,4-dioxygenase, alpha subunit